MEEGFIRLGARVHSSTVKRSASQTRVHVFVEDSGPGVRDYLFVKFQESLDMLSQGTGIGEYIVADLEVSFHAVSKCNLRSAGILSFFILVG